MASGGCPRDLLHIAKLAFQYAGDGKVTPNVLDDALKRARVEHLRPIRQEDFDILAQIHLNKQLKNSPEEYRLFNHRFVVHYNDEDWYDAHPLVWEDRRFKQALAKLTAN
jgi:hypothetical protein